MKFLIFHFLFIFFLMKLSFGHRKFRKHATNIDGLDNGALKFDQFFNQTEHKLFNQLLHNFNENEQMSQIISIFKTIKMQVKREDEKLTNFSNKVLAVNQEIMKYYSSNIFDLHDKTHMKTQLNVNIQTLRKAKHNMTSLLWQIQGIFFYFLSIFIEFIRKKFNKWLDINTK